MSTTVCDFTTVVWKYCHDSSVVCRWWERYRWLTGRRRSTCHLRLLHSLPLATTVQSFAGLLYCSDYWRHFCRDSSLCLSQLVGVFYWWNFAEFNERINCVACCSLFVTAAVMTDDTDRPSHRLWGDAGDSCRRLNADKVHCIEAYSHCITLSQWLMIWQANVQPTLAKWLTSSRGHCFQLSGPRYQQSWRTSIHGTYHRGMDKLSGIIQPSSCLHYLLPAPREQSLTARFRSVQKYPRVY